MLRVKKVNSVSLIISLTIVIFGILLATSSSFAGTPFWRDYPGHGVTSIAGQVDCDDDGFDDLVIGYQHQRRRK